jgi:pyruvate dehydrogenase E1 component alpha subunit
MVPELRDGREDKAGMTSPADLTEKENIKDIPPEILKSLYTTMQRIRTCEEKIADLLSDPAEIICPVHLYTGEEAVAAGTCTNLTNDDRVFSTHRSHGHYIAKGGDINGLMAEIYGRATGCSKGRGGSMHLANPEIGFPGSTAIVGGDIPLAVGAALAAKLRRNNAVAVAFFGDGSVNEGIWYESLNLSALKKLPVIFVCENNLYSTHMPVDECLANPDIYKKAENFNMPGIRIDGNDVIQVYSTVKKAVENARQGNGPALIECMTYRWRGHVGPNYDTDKGLRSQREVNDWMDRCPIRALRHQLLEQGIFPETELSQIDDSISKEIGSALAFAKASPYPEENELLQNVFKS